MGGAMALALCAGTLLAPPVVAATVDEIIAKHVQAHGGAQNWDTITSMEIAGSYTAFSEVTPFTLHRKRDDKYHLDSLQNAKKYVVGYDGESAWWDNHWMQEGAQAITGPDYDALMRDVEFSTPFFDYKEKGHQVELIGETEFEGLEVIGIKLTRADETEEHWYLDPETYLAVARTSPGSDFGRPMTQRTFFDDYREVAGVQIPYLTETQWYTRDRVMSVDSVRTNIDIDDALFRMPLPLGMEPLRFLEGNWQVSTAQRRQPESDWNESELTSVIEARMNGALLEEHFETDGTEFLRSLSYDRFSETYRMTQMSSRTTHLDVREGGMGDDGRLTVSNKETGTTQTVQGGMTLNTRTSIFDIREDGFQTETELSVDGGESWFVAVKSTYTRQEPETASN
jgi:hypothetical protein